MAEVEAALSKAAAAAVPAPVVVEAAGTPEGATVLTGVFCFNGRPTLRSGAPGHMDDLWRCSVKNGFIHVVDTSGEQPQSFGSPIKPSCGKGSALQRCSSVPSRLCCEASVANVAEDENLSARYANCESWSVRYTDCEHLDFEWGTV